MKFYFYIQINDFDLNWAKTNVIGCWGPLNKPYRKLTKNKDVSFQKFTNFTYYGPECINHNAHNVSLSFEIIYHVYLADFVKRNGWPFDTQLALCLREQSVDVL